MYFLICEANHAIALRFEICGADRVVLLLRGMGLAVEFDH